MQSPCSGSIELTKEYALPCPQDQAALFNHEHFRRSDQCGFDMGGGVAFQVAVAVVPGNDLVMTFNISALTLGSALSFMVPAAVV